MQTQHRKRSSHSWSVSSPSDNLGRGFDGMPDLNDVTDPSRHIWDAIRDIPGVRTWRILRDSAFLLTSLPLALAAFIVGVTGFAVGLSLSWLLVGIPILIWTIGLTLRFASYERERLNTLLNLDLGVPRYPVNNGENVVKHMWTVVRSPQVRGDLTYMFILFPIAIIELVIVWLPMEFFLPSLMHLAIGSLSPFDVFAMQVDSRFEALVFLGLGAVVMLPTLILMSIVTNLHAGVARKLLDRR